ncbi:MAG: VOC family protein [Acidobacteria bacterium]|nr:VOC family protein [Acidobacteriota bacterium]
MRGSDPTPYILLPGTAREALHRYRDVFGGELELHTFGEFGRSDGAADLIAHGTLKGLVSLYSADVGAGEAPFGSTGLLLSLLGTTGPEDLRSWFTALAEGGTVIDPLAERGWNAWDGRVRDRFGVTWLIGWEHDGSH